MISITKIQYLIKCYFLCPLIYSVADQGGWGYISSTIPWGSMADPGWGKCPPPQPYIAFPLWKSHTPYIDWLALLIKRQPNTAALRMGDYNYVMIKKLRSCKVQKNRSNFVCEKGIFLQILSRIQSDHCCFKNTANYKRFSSSQLSLFVPLPSPALGSTPVVLLFNSILWYK